MEQLIENEYPRTFGEFIDWFRNEEDCLRYLSKLKWPEGFLCRKCGGSKKWQTKKWLFHCADCGHQNSVTAGTIFQDSKKPLRQWFYVLWLMMSQKTGVSAENLKEMMGFGSYETTWNWLHKLRRVMIRPGREKLQGTVEVDETYIGGQEKGVKGRQTESKILVVVAVEGVETKVGRIRFRCIDSASEKNLIPFVEDYVEKKSKIITDGWPSYNNLTVKGYTHEKRIIRTSKKLATDLLPNVHLVITLLKRWIRGTHQGNVSEKHMPYYLDEFSFRFNRRFSNCRGLLFYRLLQAAVKSVPITNSSLIAE